MPPLAWTTTCASLPKEIGHLSRWLTQGSSPSLQERSCFHFLLFCFSLIISFSSFKYIPLLAFVSGFNKRCFFRSRCSMEMCVLTTWCGIAGIGLGHLRRREHDSTPQSGVEAPRLLKRSLPRLYYCCFFGHCMTCVYDHPHLRHAPAN